MKTKICCHCKEKKQVDLFFKNSVSRDGLAPLCKACSRMAQKKYRSKNKKKFSNINKEYYGKIKNEVLSHYSGGLPRCAECNYSDIRALTIDHINNDGNNERKKNKNRHGVHLYCLLKRNNYPIGYQVLCYNCNVIKYREFISDNSR